MTDRAGPAAAEGETGGRTSTPAARPSRRAWLRREGLALLELTAASGLTVTQPLLDITGHSPDFFLFYGAGAAQVLMFLVLFTLGPPVVLWGLGALTELAGRRARTIAHAATLGGLFVALAVQVGKHLTGVRGLPLALVAVAAGAGLTAGYLRWRALQQALRFASAGPLLFAAMFVFASPASAVVLPADKGGTAVAAPDAGRHPDIVVLLLDEFPQVSLLDGAGRIDATRFPNFARLAATSTWYRNATAVSGWTPYAVPAMLSGLFPRKDVAPHYSTYPNNLFTLLDSTYDIRAEESITQLCPPRDCGAGSQGWSALPTMLRKSADLLGDIFSPDKTRRQKTEDYREPTVKDAGSKAPAADPRFRFDRLGDNQPARFRQFLAELAPNPTGRPTLHFLHLLLPHQPWRYLPDGTQYDAPDNLPNDGDQWWTQLGRQRHELQVQYVDRLIGQVLDAMRAGGELDHSTLVVTADHGISFTRGAAGRTVTPQKLSAAAEMLWVPLFIKAPEQHAGRLDDRNWLHVDLLPTLADYAGVPVTWRTDGISALRGLRETTGKQYHDDPAEPFQVPGPPYYAKVRHDAVPVVPPMPLPELVGRAVDALPVSDGGPTVEITNASWFDEVNPASGSLPALVFGHVPDAVPAGTLLAIAVNGRIGAVVPVALDGGTHRFAGMVTEESLFHSGHNQVEVYQVTGGGTGLQRTSR